MEYTVSINPDEDGVYVAEVRSLPGCVSQGPSRAEALANVREAIALYLESLEEHGDPVPPLGGDDSQGPPARRMG